MATVTRSMETEEAHDNERRIQASWRANASAWVRAVRSGEIESRRLVTDAAIVDAVCARSPAFVLDLGCGEGWLARRLVDRGLEVLGLDAEPQLVDAARRAGRGSFRVGSYLQLLDEASSPPRPADVAVCNFSLFGAESVAALFASVPRLLRPDDGVFIVQTLHPLVVCKNLPYRDGWREGSWDGFSAQFTDPAPWYFRTLESWVSLFAASNLSLREMREPLHPATGRPASVIFIATVR